jgi:hypothetical protein
MCRLHEPGSSRGNEAHFVLKTAIEQQSREATKLPERWLCGKSSSKPDHPADGNGFSAKPAFLRAFATLLLIPSAAFGFKWHRPIKSAISKLLQLTANQQDAKI